MTLPAEYEIVLLDYASPGLLERQAAALSLEHIQHHGKPGYAASGPDIDRYIQSVGASETHYAIVHKQLGTLAAMTAVEFHSEPHTTFVWEIATNPAERRHHLGSELLRYVAHQAIKCGDERLRLHPYVPEFFAANGFTPDPENDSFMEAKAAVLAGSE